MYDVGSGRPGVGINRAFGDHHRGELGEQGAGAPGGDLGGFRGDAPLEPEGGLGRKAQGPGGPTDPRRGKTRRLK